MTGKLQSFIPQQKRLINGESEKLRDTALANRLLALCNIIYHNMVNDYSFKIVLDINQNYDIYKLLDIPNIEFVDTSLEIYEEINDTKTQKLDSSKNYMYSNFEIISKDIPKTFYKDILQTIKIKNRQLEKIVKRLINNKSYIGIHLRRGNGVSGYSNQSDFLMPQKTYQGFIQYRKSLENIECSDYESFHTPTIEPNDKVLFDLIKDETDKNTNIFIASDLPNEYTKYITESFPNVASSHNFMRQLESLSKALKINIIYLESIFDLFVLSKCDYIYATKKTTFPLVASYMSQCENINSIMQFPYENNTSDR